MSVLEVLLRDNTPIKDIPELPICQRCGRREAPVPTDIGEVEYALCVPCLVRSPTWSIPK